MKSRLLSLVAGFALVAASAQAADLSGKWVAQVPGRDGSTRETTFTFKVDGEKLTGSMPGRQGDINLADGKVKGDDVSFSVTMSMQGNDMKILYSGKVSGDEIKFTRQREGSEQKTEFTAKRSK